MGITRARRLLVILGSVSTLHQARSAPWLALLAHYRARGAVPAAAAAALLPPGPSSANVTAPAGHSNARARAAGPPWQQLRKAEAHSCAALGARHVPPRSPGRIPMTPTVSMAVRHLPHSTPAARPPMLEDNTRPRHKVTDPWRQHMTQPCTGPSLSPTRGDVASVGRGYGGVASLLARGGWRGVSGGTPSGRITASQGMPAEAPLAGLGARPRMPGRVLTSGGASTWRCAATARLGRVPAAAMATAFALSWSEPHRH